MLLRKHGIMHSISTSEEITRLGFFGRWKCSHMKTTSFTRIDHRAGPGWMSDAYEGEVCCDCGHVLSEEKTY